MAAGWYAPPWGVKTPDTSAWCPPAWAPDSLTMRSGSLRRMSRRPGAKGRRDRCARFSNSPTMGGRGSFAGAHRGHGPVGKAIHASLDQSHHDPGTADRHPGEEAGFRSQLAAEHDRHPGAPPRWTPPDRSRLRAAAHPSPESPDLVRSRCRNRPPIKPARRARRQKTSVEHGAGTGHPGIGHGTADARNQPAADAARRASFRYRRHTARRKPSGWTASSRTSIVRPSLPSRRRLRCGSGRQPRSEEPPWTALATSYGGSGASIRRTASSNREATRPIRPTRSRHSRARHV